MRSGKFIFLSAILSLAAACSGGGGAGSSVVLPASKGPAMLVSISVAPVNASMSAGASRQFVATGIYSDNTKKNISNEVTWSSSDESVALISNAAGDAGMLQSAATGTTLISAVTGSLSASSTLKVTSGGNLTGANILPVTVNGSLCSASTSASYPNKPCVSVTICTPGTSVCQTVNDILLDTGSYGLRLFNQAVTVPLQQVTAGSRNLAECVHYGDGSSQWGPVQRADVVLGGEPPVTVPIQVIDQAFAKPPASCTGTNADTNPAQAGFNGILGVGLFSEDCGPACVSSQANGMYYTCTSSTCSGTAVPLSTQVQNPVALLPVDNNGVVLSLPSVPPGGASSATGALILGIGTRSNNAPWSVTVYPANSGADFTTTYNGRTYTNSFIDSGSNGFFFPGTMMKCSGWFCPSSPQLLLATNRGAAGTPGADVSFPIGNATALFSSGMAAFDDLGSYSAGMFDWGLPFFLGRDIYVGMDGKTSPLATGPYWAY